MALPSLLMLLLQVAAGLGHCLGVLTDGSVTSWGWNSAGESSSSCRLPACLWCPSLPLKPVKLASPGGGTAQVGAGGGDEGIV